MLQLFQNANKVPVHTYIHSWNKSIEKNHKLIKKSKSLEDLLSNALFAIIKHILALPNKHPKNSPQNFVKTTEAVAILNPLTIQPKIQR